MVSSQRLAKGPTDRQIETILPDGRRRITPLYIPLDSVGPEGGEGGPPLTFSSSRQEKSKILVEKRENSSCSLPPVPATVATPQPQVCSGPDLTIAPSKQNQSSQVSQKPSQPPQQQQQQPPPVHTQQMVRFFFL